MGVISLSTVVVWYEPATLLSSGPWSHPFGIRAFLPPDWTAPAPGKPAPDGRTPLGPIGLASGRPLTALVAWKRSMCQVGQEDDSKMTSYVTVRLQRPGVSDDLAYSPSTP